MTASTGIVALIAGILGLTLLALLRWTLKRKRYTVSVITGLAGALLVTLSALFATITVATKGYRALTHEEIVAWVRLESTGPRSFRAHVRFPGGRTAEYDLAGDELYVDAHILKWKSIANMLGLHTAYELDRIAGRYRNLADEQTNPRTVHSLALDKPVDMFALRRKFRWLAPVLDAEYGSATFINARPGVEFEIRVSTTGLLVRAPNPSG